MKNIANKTIWITGATSGIGEALAIEAAKFSGTKLVLSARRTDELARVAKTLNLPTERLLVLPLDLTMQDNYSELANKVAQTFGTIDILINNGGISARLFAKDASLEIDRKLMEVNFFGTVALTKAVLPAMLKQNSGQIVVISSVTGTVGTPMRTSYAASKHALHGYYDSLRGELYGNNIAVTLICPGYINTSISVNALAANGEKHGKMDSNQANGMQPSVFAKKTWRAISKRKQQFTAGGKEVIAVYLKRFFPILLSRIVRNAKVVDE